MLSEIRMIWLLLVFCVGYGGSQLQFTVEEPRSQAVRTGGNVTLSCSASASSYTEWFVGNPPNTVSLSTSNDGRVSAVRSQLNITAFHASEDANLYSCLVGLPGGNGIYTCPANISHARITTEFLRSPSPTVAPAGTTVILHCRPPFSNPAPLLEWRKDGIPLQAGAGGEFEVLPSGNLYLINAARNDTGVYECVVVNPVSGARRRSVGAQLNITDPTSTPAPPNITLPPTDTEVVVGGTVILECAATGHPTPSISWVRVHTSEPSSASFPSSTRELPSGALSFVAVTALDGGRYRCMAENDDGVVAAEAVVTVKVPPRVTLPSTSTSITAGDSLNLTCWVSGTDQVTVIWYKGATLLTTEAITPSAPSSTLSLSSVTLSDGGLYECMALNHLGCSHVETTVAVLEPTEPTTSVTVEVIPDQLTLLPGMTASATCLASGSPVPSIYWDVNGQIRRSSFETTSGQEVRGVLSVDQGGTYTCIALSGGQSQRAVLNVTEIAVTSPPPTSTQTPTQTMTGSGSILIPSLVVVASSEHIPAQEGQAVNLSCTVIGGRGVDVSWLLDGREAPGRITMQPVQLGVVSTLQLDAVTAAHDGEFECVASDSGGETSSASITVTVTLRNSPHRPPTHAPGNVSATWLPTGYILVKWDAVDTSSLPSQLLGYKLNWDVHEAVSQSARGAVSSDQLQYMMTTRLDPKSSHTILVWAYSLGGDGPPARVQLPPLLVGPTTEGPATTHGLPTTTEATPEATPEATTEGPTHIDARIISCQSSSPTELQLSWQAGSHDLGVTYELLYGCNMADTQQRMRLDPRTSMVTLTHLLPRCEYWLQVEMFSSSPAPVVSNECHVVMPAGQIDINAQVEWQQNGSVVVRWTRPDNLHDDASLEINVGGRGWEPISSGAHVLAELNPSRVHEIELRLSSAQWQGSVNLTVPSASPPTTSDAGGNTTDLGLLYGVIFGILLIACAVLVVVILGLKYIQMTRRDTDKVINHREKQQETFRRLSLQRSSVSSIKKSPLPNHKTNGNIYM